MSGLQLGLEFKQNKQRMGIAKAELGQKAQELQMQGQRLQIQDQALTQGMKLKIQDAQRKFQAQQGYQACVNGGGDPVECMMKFGPQMGESLSGLGTIANARRQAAAIPKEISVTPDGTHIWQAPNGSLVGFNKPTKADLPGQLTPSQSTAARMLKSTIDKLDARISKADPVIDKAKVPGWEKTRDRMQKQLDALIPEQALDDGTDDSDGQSPDDVVATYDPKTGTFKKSDK
jgi:exonuclease VII large subunit